MAKSSLAEIPNEVLLHIFKSADSFATVTSLSSASRRLRAVWEINCCSICFGVVARAIPCYDQAFEYVRVQPQGITNSKPVEDKATRVIRVMKQFQDNANVAFRAWQIHEIQVKQGILCRISCTNYSIEGQRTCFLKAWYRVHTLASLPAHKPPYEILASLNLLELEQMLKVLWWLMYWCPDEHRSELRITFQDGCLEGRRWYGRLPKSPITAERWNDLKEGLRRLYQHVQISPLDDRPPSEKRAREDEDLCFGHFMVHKVLRGNKNSEKTKRLAAMLPGFGAQGAPNQRYRPSYRRQDPWLERKFLQ